MLLTIGYSAFEGTSISEISFPASLQSLGQEAFFKCRKLKIIRWPDHSDLVEIDSKCFAECSALKKFDFGENTAITEITGRHIFDGTDGCQIVVPKSVIKFNATMFPGGCSVVLSPENEHFVCDEVFIYSSDRLFLHRCFGCVTRVVVPRYVEVLGSRSFSGCSSIHDIEFESCSHLRKLCGHVFDGLSLSHLVLPKGLCNFKASSFSGCHVDRLCFEEESELRDLNFSFGHVCSLELPCHLERLEVKSLSEVDFISVCDSNPFFVSDSHFLFDHEKTKFIFAFDPSMVEVFVPSHVAVLCRHCFYGRSNVCSIKFESSSCLQKIESEAFCGTSIDDLFIPRCVNCIEDGAFCGCSRLRRIVFDEYCELRYIGCSMFKDTSLDYLYLSRNVCDIGRGSLFGIKRVEVSSANVHLDCNSRCFLDCFGIGRFVEDVFVLHDYVEEVSSATFCTMDSLRSVSFSGSALKVIGSHAFCESELQEITIPQSVRSIGISAFNTTPIHFVSFDKLSQVRCLPILCFSGTGFLRSISIPASVEVIDESCFWLSAIQWVKFCYPTKIKLRQMFVATVGL